MICETSRLETGASGGTIRIRLPTLFCMPLVLLACSGQTGQAGETSAAPQPIPRGAHYVAMGSSYAAGPGITEVVAGSPPRCARSRDNYAEQLARRRGLDLTDATCSGAKTSHILGSWDELPPQLDALRADTRLVTVTIGGNDLNWMGGLFAASCKALGLGAQMPQLACNAMEMPSEADYTKVRASLLAIARMVHQRSPSARLVFVDYATLLPPKGHCDAMPLTDQDADRARAVARRLLTLTEQAAREGSADVLRASDATRGHGACAKEPWMNGFARPGGPAPGAVYHPTQAGMTAVAEALDRYLGR